MERMQRNEDSGGGSRRLFLMAWLASLALLIGLVATDSRIDTRNVPLAPFSIWSVPDDLPADSWQRVVVEHEDGFPHSPTVMEHANGELQAVWFHGSREAHPSVGLWTSRLGADGGWSGHDLLLDRHDDMAGLGYRIHTIGNPVLFAHPSGEAWLFHVNPSLGGWSTSRVALRRSADNGLSWSSPVQLPTGPVFSMSTLVRTVPLLLENDLVALPAYHELIGKHAEFLFLDAAGRLVGKRYISAGIQPSIAGGGDGSLLALLRGTVGMPTRLHIARSTDGGIGWSEAVATSLSNPHQPACAVVLNDGSTLFGYNPDDIGRRRIAFVHIDGQSAQWRMLPHVIAAEGQAEAAYCTAIQRQNGDVTVVYSDPPGRRILEFGFTPAWLSGQLADAEVIQP